ncbi:MAG: hypothetical protein JF606_18435 [Burkholderiales bacterium]|nr:hypothetical protein [Burkholderiales bacterium]
MDGRQHGVDPKRFTGKGAARQERDAQDEVDKVHAEMVDLIKLTHSIPGRLVQLCLHHRTKTTQKSLRWRDAVSGGHLPWDGMELRFAACGAHVAKWYREVDHLARQLNEREKSARYVLKATKRLSATAKQQPVEGRR